MSISYTNNINLLVFELRAILWLVLIRCIVSSTPESPKQEQLIGYSFLFLSLSKHAKDNFRVSIHLIAVLMILVSSSKSWMHS